MVIVMREALARLPGGGCLSSVFKVLDVGPYLQSGCRRSLNNVPSGTELSLMLSE